MRLHHRNGTILASAALLGLTLFGARASAVPQSVVAAVNANDVTALEALSKSAPTAEQRALAAGALLALHHEDADAIATLIPLTGATTSSIVRATAYLALSDVYCRNQHYRSCYSAIRAAVQLSPRSVNSGYRQAMGFAQALVDVKPMQLVREASGSLPITEEKAGMIRVTIDIDGHPGGALVDTGASFSTISASVARRTGIHMLSQAASVGSSTERAVAVRLGLARQLQIGNAVLKNVLFIVVPDSGWGIPRRFRISAIIGMPVLMALGPLELVNSGAPTLRYDARRGKRASPAGAHSNLLLSSLEPLVLVRVPGAAVPLRMKLDTGSNITTFTQNARAHAPTLFAHAERYTWHVAGMGGVVTEHRALRLPEVPLTIGGQTIIMKNVVVSSRAGATSDGVIGEDIFRQGRRWTADFKAMTLAVSK